MYTHVHTHAHTRACTHTHTPSHSHLPKIEKTSKTPYQLVVNRQNTLMEKIKIIIKLKKKKNDSK